MPTEPRIKRPVAFLDGQDLFYAAKEAFGYPYPNYDPKLLTERICAAHGWSVAGIYFYTGVPSVADKPFWNHFRTAKMAVMGTRGIRTFSCALRYRNQTTSLSDDTLAVTLAGQEKGVDIRLALDIVRFALEGDYDVAPIFSQDQDLSRLSRM
jgi:uncharacterized LabA/DUF88 family protein